MKEAGFVQSLRDDMKRVRRDIRERVNKPGGLCDEELLSLVSDVHADPATNGFIEHVGTDDVTDVSAVTASDVHDGEEMMRSGHVAFVILAGGAGTRFGQPKALVRIPQVGMTLVGWKLLASGRLPTWVMASPSNSGAIHAHVSTLVHNTPGVVFEQFDGYRLTPDNVIMWSSPGVPSLHPLGHGDVGPALASSGVLDDNPRVKHIVMSNVDNVLGFPHPGILGMHVRLGSRVTCEVVDRLPGDDGGTVVSVNGHPQVVEAWRLPDGFAGGCALTSTNTTIIDVDVLRNVPKWRWHRVRKRMGASIVVQHERLLQQHTEDNDTLLVKVAREERYLPIKRAEDLAVAGETLAKRDVGWLT